MDVTLKVMSIYFYITNEQIMFVVVLYIEIGNYTSIK